MMYLFLLGKVLFGGFFIMSGYNHFKNLVAYTGYAQSKGVPMAKLAVLVTGIMLILGGAGVLLGIYVQCALVLLALFLIFTTPKMHTYWKISDPMMKAGERVNFYKNVALLGGVLMLLALHSGTIITWSLF